MPIRDDNKLKVLRQLKQDLANYEKVPCISADLTGSDLDPEVYSNSLYLYRSAKDAWMYLHDNDDNTNGKLSLDNLKIILDNLTARIIQEEEERKELEEFLNSDDE